MGNSRSYEILQLTKQINFTLLDAVRVLTTEAKGSGVPTNREVADYWAASVWCMAEALYDKYAAEEQKELDAYQEPEK